MKFKLNQNDVLIKAAQCMGTVQKGDSLEGEEQY